MLFSMSALNLFIYFSRKKQVVVNKSIDYEVHLVKLSSSNYHLHARLLDLGRGTKGTASRGSSRLPLPPLPPLPPQPFSPRPRKAFSAPSQLGIFQTRVRVLPNQSPIRPAGGPFRAVSRRVAPPSYCHPAVGEWYDSGLDCGETQPSKARPTQGVPFNSGALLW